MEIRYNGVCVVLLTFFTHALLIVLNKKLCLGHTVTAFFTLRILMKKLVFVPLELIEERYSQQWYNWFCQFFHENLTNINIKIILPESGCDNKIITGEFLDVVGTNRFKAEQLQELCKLIQQGELDNDTTLLFMDAWFPGLEMLAYIRDGLNLKFKLVGMLHAGTWDDHDFLYQKGMRYWAKYIERGWLELLDGICVATHFHKMLILKNTPFTNVNYNDLFSKIHVTGFPIYPTFVSPCTYPKTYITFPHRLAPEKQPEKFEQLTEKVIADGSFHNQYHMCVTKKEFDTKEMYYYALNKSIIAVSFALQETLGIAMIESVLCGAIPIVPNRLSYAELYPGEFKYDAEDDVSQVFLRIKHILSNEQRYKNSLLLLQKKFIELGYSAIPNIIKVCNGVHHD